ncbi:MULTISPECIES: hypothetical protein [Pandoraea]|uniref:Uncharacterized protein n=2 Tax=Pandoraea TaxID=93217 RepID=A0A5E4XFI2_9BURK|nr:MULTISPECIES: hypothetical protein [Pandoraea]ALS62012.1 hypothetical protein AT302_21710 [Pandoraea norimbergensis]VVE35144.1 hypothetical protein PIN31009_03835 [Pandoraea iniqua]VVE39449.1 hypothetical protein PIN31115_04059 [Pandoraea iniqua]
MAYVTPFYKGFRLETMVFRGQHPDSIERKHDRTFVVAVRITRATLEDLDYSGESKTYKLQSLPFDSIGEARRAGNNYAQGLVDNLVESGAKAL